MSAELKRVSFMTIDSSSDFLKKPEKESTTGSSKNKTIRLDLEIFEPDEYKFPEFNYKKLIHIEKKKIKKLAKIPNGLHENDPFGDADDDVARIAREMEAKYGTGSSYSKASRTEFDRGAGYDDNDSFIDNTEAYDEQIPVDVETVRGGFYVNSGLLEFKKMPNFERPGDEIRMPKAKKRALSTTSESSDSENDEQQKESSSVTVEKPKKKKLNIEKNPKIKSATSSSDEQGKAAKKAKKDKQEKPKENIAAIKENVKTKPIEKETADDSSKKAIKTTTVKDMLRARRDNLRKMEREGKSSGGTTTTTDNDDDDGSGSVSSLAVSDSSHESAHEDVAVNGAATTTTTKDLVLPIDFSPELVQLITSLKQYVETTARHNSNFFDNHVKEQLIKIDSTAKSQSAQIRVQAYNQLEIFIPCSKKGILAKVGRYRIQQADAKVKVEIKKLKALINTTMPDLVRKYDEDVKGYENLRNIQHIVGDNTMEQKIPRKKFHWNDNSRQILCDIIQLIQDLYKVSKVKKETIEEFSLRYLKDHLIPLWPEGWIKIEDFHKEFERKRKKDAKTSGTTPQVINQPFANSNSNGKQSTTASTASTTTTPQKTEMRIKADIDINVSSIVNGKSLTVQPVQLSPQQSSSSVIKKSSDHSINSIMSSTSPSPPIHSTGKVTTPSVVIASNIQSDSKTRVIDLDKLSSPNDLLKVSAKDMSRNVQKFTSQYQSKTIDISPEKIRISDGSDSDCAIIDSPTKTTLKPLQQQQQINNNKLSNPATMHQQGETKKTKKHDDNYSSLIKNIASLTDPKKNSQSFLSNPLTSSLSEQRKMDTSHD